MQEAQPRKGLSNIELENFALNANAQNMSKEMERILAENELLITEWSPIHLHEMLKTWFWKDDVHEISAANVWQQTCQQLYLPRLKDDIVFQSTLNKGSDNKDYFGFAHGKKDDEYNSFSFGKSTSPPLETLLLIEPSVASEYQNKLDNIVQSEKRTANTKIEQIYVGSGSTESVTEKKIELERSETVEEKIRKRFYASIELDSLVAKKQFSDLVDEVILQFTSKIGVKVKISLEIEAESASGFDESLQRAVKENCNVMKFKNAEFE